MEKDSCIYNVQGCSRKPYTKIAIVIEIGDGEYTQTLEIDLGSPIEKVYLGEPERREQCTDS